MTEQHQKHPLTLESSLKKTIEKLIKYKVLTKKTPEHSAFCVHPEFELPVPPDNLIAKYDGTIISASTDIERLRQECETSFWSLGTSAKNDESAPKLDKIWIVGEEKDCDPDSNSNIVSRPNSDIRNGCLTSLQFKQQYLYRNIPCIVRNILLPVTKHWYHSNTPSPQNEDMKNTLSKGTSINLEWFLENVGAETIVPIRMNQEGFQDGRALECLTSKITMKEWIDHQRYNPKNYLKDWHMQSLFHDMYKTPHVFDDALNPFLLDNDGGDYRFVYWGCEGSNTGIHSDVLNSFSWSYNVVGKKQWIFYHPDDFSGSGEGAMIVTQDQGEVMFVPSGWRHSVKNLEETISVNHNWIIPGALDCVLACLLDEIEEIEEELCAWDTMPTDEIAFNRVKEDMLRGCVGMDITTFCVLVLDCFATNFVDIHIDRMLKNKDYLEKWIDFMQITRVLGLIIEMIDDETLNDSQSLDHEKQKVIIDIDLRMISTLGEKLGLEVIGLMNIMHEIGVKCIQRKVIDRKFSASVII